MASNINELAPAGERQAQLLKTASYYAAFVILGLTVASLGPTLPGLAEQTASSLSQASYLFTARALGYVLGSLLGGRLYDRLPGHRLLAPALLLIALTLAFVPAIPLLGLMIFVFLLTGVGEGSMDVGANTLLVWVHKEKVSPFMNGLHFFFGFGALISPVIVAQVLLATGGIAWTYWILALLTLPAAVLVLLQPSPPHQNQAGSQAVGDVDYRLVGLIAVFFFLYVGAEAVIGGWIFTYATATGLGTLTTAAYLTSGFWIAFTLGRLIGVPLAARFRPRRILVVDLLGCFAALGLILSLPESEMALWVGVCGLGLAMASVFPTMISFAGRRLPLNGRITGIFFVGVGLGAMLAPWLAGQLIEPVGPQSVIWLVLLDLLLATGLFVGMVRKGHS